MRLVFLGIVGLVLSLPESRRRVRPNTTTTVSRCFLATFPRFPSGGQRERGAGDGVRARRARRVRVRWPCHPSFPRTAEARAHPRRSRAAREAVEKDTRPFARRQFLTVARSSRVHRGRRFERPVRAGCHTEEARFGSSFGVPVSVRGFWLSKECRASLPVRPSRRGFFRRASGARLRSLA